MRIDPKNLQHCSLKSPSSQKTMVLDFVDEPESPEYKFFSAFIKFAATEFPYLSPIYDKYFSCTDNFKILEFEGEFNAAVYVQSIEDSKDPKNPPKTSDDNDLKFASKPLLKHILTFCYYRAVYDPKQLNKYKPFSAHVYGEMSFEAMDELLKVFGSTKNVQFIDLGVGQVVMQISASVQCDSCIGIEISEVPYAYSIEFAKHFRDTMEWFGKYYSPFELINADFTLPLYNSLILKSNFIFANNVMYGCELNNKLSAIFRDVPDGSQIFSSFPFIPKNFRLSRRTANEFGAVSRMNTINLNMDQMVSWTPKAIPLYQHVIDNKALLELVANLSGQDTLENLDLNQFSKPSKYNRKRVKSLSTKLDNSPKRACNGHHSELVDEKQLTPEKIESTISGLSEAILETIKHEPTVLSSFISCSPIKEPTKNNAMDRITNGIILKKKKGELPKLAQLALNGHSKFVKNQQNGVKEKPVVISNSDSRLANSSGSSNNLTLLEAAYSEDNEECQPTIEPYLSQNSDFMPALPPEKDLSCTASFVNVEHDVLNVQRETSKDLLGTLPIVDNKSNDLHVIGQTFKHSANIIGVDEELLVMPKRCHIDHTLQSDLSPIPEELKIAEVFKDLVPSENISEPVPELVESPTPKLILGSPTPKTTTSSRIIKKRKNKVSVNGNGLNGVNGINGIHTTHPKQDVFPLKTISTSPKIMSNISNLTRDYKLIPIPRHSVLNENVHKTSPIQKNSLNLSSQNIKNIKTMMEPVKTRPLNSKITDIDSQLLQVIQNLDLAYANIILTVNEASKTNKCPSAGLTGIAYKMYHQIHEQIDTFKEFTLNSLNELIKPIYNTETFSTHPDLD